MPPNGKGPRHSTNVYSDPSGFAIFIGSMFDVHSRDLKTFRVSAVLDMVKQFRLPFSDVKKLNYLGLRTSDTPKFPLFKYFDQTSAFIESVRYERGRVLVHCVAGLNRSVAVVAAWMVCNADMSLEEAVYQMASRRPRGLILSNVGFLYQLVDLAPHKEKFGRC